tara:strand:+ start:1880 stop:2503 length:624 start_codon:yes stop_codon:yes gene_type:complete
MILKKILKMICNKYLQYIENKNLIKKIKKTNNLKIILGSSDTKYKNWISTNERNINLLSEKTFQKIFGNKLVDNFLAEHVFEHLTKEEGKLAIKNCYKFLKPNGILRIAVPDGFFPDQDYIDATKPHGWGSGAYDHKVLYNYQTIKEIFDHNKFHLNFIEYHNEDKKFFEKKLTDINGHILRSKYNDERNKEGKINYTSLIVDAKKL